MIKRRKERVVSDAMRAMLARAGNADWSVARVAQRELAKALVLPLKQGILKGDIIGGIFEPINFPNGTSIEFPLDPVAPGSEKDFAAYTIPNHGRIPERHIEGDYVMVPTYDIASSVDWLLKYSRDARWDVLSRAMEILEASFVRKNNDDGWKVIITAGKNRGLMVYDDVATQGVFTKRLVALMKTIMRRNAGGNSTSLNQGKLTDLFVSPEALEDVRTWDLTQVDDFTRREIFLANSGNGEYSLTSVFGVTLHDIDELGVGQVYQLYFTNTLGGSLGSSDVELVVGLDLSTNDSFVMPIREDVQIFEDEWLHRQRRAGYYGWAEHGFACLDARRVVLGSF